jgi:hypothetical protein
MMTHALPPLSWPGHAGHDSGIDESPSTSVGITLNLGPLDWGRLIGANVATFFVVGQFINLIFFRASPTMPIVVGDLFIVSGGAIITLWQR